MGILHASFLEKAGFDVALVDRPDAVTHLPCGVIHLDGNENISNDDTGNDEAGMRRSTEIEKLDAPCLTINQAINFLTMTNSETDHITFTVILVTVKAHQVQKALTPFLKVLQNVSSVILLHNGLQNRSTVSFLLDHESREDSEDDYKRRDRLFATMVSCRGSTLLVKEEKPEKYADIARATGHGSAFIFRMVSGSVREDGKTMDNGCKQKEFDEEDKCITSTSDNFLTSVNAVKAAIPECAVLDPYTGRCEQIIKLAINVSLNGLLARKCLEKWYQHFKLHQLQNYSYSNFMVSTSIRPGDIPDQYALSLTRRIVNKEIISELPLARSIARLVLQKAHRAEPANHQIYDAVLKDEAAQRTHDTLHKVPENVCSTVVDIMNMRMTERDALFEMLMNDWSFKMDDLIGEDDIKFCAADVGRASDSCVDNLPSGSACTAIPTPSREEALKALEEIDCMLKVWNIYIERLNDI